jgi:hypothetical protein
VRFAVDGGASGGGRGAENVTVADARRALWSFSPAGRGKRHRRRLGGAGRRNVYLARSGKRAARADSGLLRQRLPRATPRGAARPPPATTTDQSRRTDPTRPARTAALRAASAKRFIGGAAGAPRRSFDPNNPEHDRTDALAAYVPDGFGIRNGRALADALAASRRSRSRRSRFEPPSTSTALPDAARYERGRQGTDPLHANEESDDVSAP